MFKSGRIAGRANRAASVPEMRFTKNGETHERGSRSCFIRQFVTYCIVLPASGGRSLQSSLLPAANELMNLLPERESTTIHEFASRFGF